MRVVVTRISHDGAMRRRMVDTAVSGDVGPWEELIARALAAPPPYCPVPGGRSTIFASMTRLSWSPSTSCPGRCMTWSPPCSPSVRRHIEPMTSRSARALRAASRSTGRTRVVLAARTADMVGGPPNTTMANRFTGMGVLRHRARARDNWPDHTGRSLAWPFGPCPRPGGQHLRPHMPA